MPSWTAEGYCLTLAGEPAYHLATRVLDLVWRFDFQAPGFCLLDAGPGVDSHTLRSWMVKLKSLVTTGEEVAVEKQQEFVSTDAISQKVYQT